MEQKNCINQWPLIESITSEILEDEFDSLSPKEIKKIEDKIEKGEPIIEDLSSSGMEFDYGSAITMVSICMTSISILIEFYKFRKDKISKNLFLKMISSNDNPISGIEVPDKIKDFLIAHYDEIVDKV